MKIPGFNCKVTFDAVVAHRKKGEIEELAKSMAMDAEGAPNPASGSRGWFRYYQVAKKQTKADLTEEEYDEYTEELAQWKKAGVPLEVQIASVSALVH